jgi:hypothetical protein
VTILTVTQDNPVGVAVDGSHVFWTEFGELWKLPLSGGGLPSLITTYPGDAAYLTLDATEAYWLSPSELGRVPLDGLSPPSVIASGLVNAMDVAVDGQDAYFTTAAPNASIAKLALGGGSPVVLAANLTSPSGIAIDATTIYWADPGSGQIMKLAK